MLLRDIDQSRSPFLSPALEPIDADDDQRSNEIFDQIVDVFMKETRLDSLVQRAEAGRGGSALVRDANDYM